MITKTNGSLVRAGFEHSYWRGIHGKKYYNVQHVRMVFVCCFFSTFTFYAFQFQPTIFQKIFWNTSSHFPHFNFERLYFHGLPDHFCALCRGKCISQHRNGGNEDVLCCFWKIVVTEQLYIRNSLAEGWVKKFAKNKPLASHCPAPDWRI